ncbi:enoyl-CoA hydratase domain-containing protein 3, mitochondrial [Leptopilina heterotoma]|uniref:enoyl-CoA hydratase domain-containing protein 3, mitochondrial n=1 Tax=Leptopilina heterotoma TaxID=63436 RepID=UPI001CA8CA31|nr:enoyl-CoA hydratase domain-containing protein 3, mitochondrial [Leptopilina heterotoma]
MNKMSSFSSRRIFSSINNLVGGSITRTISTSRILTSKEKYVEIEQKNGVRRITLNHAKSRNSLSLETINILLYNISKDVEDNELGSIVIQAAPGKVFSAGHNLKELTSENRESHHLAVFETFEMLMKEIMQCPVPIIAAVDGLAAAAGCQLVAACDIAICTEKSSFSTPGANVGIFCSTPGIPLVRNVPRKVAFHMLLTGLPISAKEAYDAGLVSKVVPNDKLEDEIQKITNAINSQSRSVTRLGKRFLFEQLDVDISTAYSLGTEIMVENLKLKDSQEGIKSFIEKRKPLWSHNYEQD